MTLTRRLLLLALISVLPAIAIWTYTEVSLRRAREAEINDFAIRQAQLAASEIERIFEGIRSLLIAVEEVPSVRGFEVQGCTAFLKNLQVRVPYLDAIVVADATGKSRCQQGAAPKEGFRGERYFQETLATGQFAIGEFTRSLSGKDLRPALPLALAFRDDTGNILGAVVATLDLRWLGGQLQARALPQDGSLTISDRNGIIIARHPLSEQFVGTRIPETFDKYINDNKAGAFEALSQDGVKRIIGYMPTTMAPRGIYVSAGISSKIAFEAINRAAKRGFMLIAAALLLAVSLSGLIGRIFVTKPFETMTKAVRSWRRGNYDARIDLRGSPGELGLLASAFNDLMNDVSERQKALQASEERARLALDTGHMGTWWFDHRTKVSGWSPQAAVLFGYPPGRSAITIPEWKDVIYPDDADSVLSKLRGAVSGTGDYEDEYRIIRPDGEVRWFSSRGRTFFNDLHQPVSTIGVFQDITSRKHAAEQQQVLLDELNHRVKNTLATVQSIASQTLRSAKDPASFKEAFESRLLALSKTHDLLTRNSWRDADLHAIAEQELSPYRHDHDKRAVIGGPRINLPARMVINFGLILHELVTNAAKYGALSREYGMVELRWSIENGHNGTPSLHMEWRETGGPEIFEPKHQGFGSRLIRRTIEGELAGSLNTDYAPTGLICTISVPLV